MLIGFAKGHDERIIPGEEKFRKLFEFFQHEGITCLEIEGEITEDDTKKFPCIVIGSPQHTLRQHEIEILRQYVHDGGNLFILLKYGGDHRLHTNIGNLFPDITPNNDELYDTKRGLKGVWGYKSMMPVLSLSIDDTHLQFEGNVLYDGGCTFSTEGDMTFSIMPEGNLASYPQPRQGQQTAYFDIKNHKELEPVMGPILVYNKIGKGSVLYWGARWSFSDDQWTKYDNAAFFKAISAMFLQNV